MKKTLKNSCFSLLSATLISATAFSGVVFAAQDSATGWKQEGSSWKHYSEAGVLTKGFIKLGEDWYYLNQADGTMKTGWLQHTDGNWYFFNTLSDGTKGKMLTGWQWIDGYCYYFSTAKDTTEGKMLANTKTPDGFLVNADGRWAEENGSVHFVAGKGQITKMTTASARTGLRSGGGSGSGGGSSRYNGGSSQTSTTDVSTNLIAADYTKLVDLGWIEYAVVTFNQGTLDDYNVFVNGIDVTSAVSKVDAEGKIAKWATTISAPKNIEVVRKSDGKRESLAYSNGRNTVAPSVGSKDLAPAYILTNGPISVFDYHLDAYDEDGNVRRFPTTNTFDLVNEKAIKQSINLPKANYVAPAEIDANGNGQIVIKLTLDENSKKWFDELSNAKVLDYEYKTLNNDATFTKEMDATYANTGIVKINLPQSNVRNNGKYFVNLGSDYSKDKYTVAVQVVRNTNYVLNQSTETPNPRIGNADVLFKIEDPSGRETFGNDIKMPVTAVDLKFPSGKVVSLKNIEEYSVIMNVLHIYEKYEDKDTKEERLLLNEVGTYEVTVHADGYKDISKKFEIGADTSYRASAEIDTYSSATGASIGGTTNADGSTSSGGGYNINANLLFEHELVANALVLNQLGLRNNAATEVINRFFAQKPESVLTSDLTPIYDFTDFLNKVKAQRLDNNTQLSFADYLSGSPKQMPYVGKIKRVLEDGKLGPVEELGESIGADTTVNGLSAKEGSDFELSFTDSEYLSKIEGIYLDGKGTALRSDSYLEEYKIEDGKLKIKASAVKSSFGVPYVGNHKLRIFAKGYKVQELTLVVERETGSIAIKAENAENLKLNQELKFEVKLNDHEASNVLSNLKSVVIINKADNTEKNVLPIGQESNDIGYKIDGSNIVLAAKTVKAAGNYTLVLKTNGYGQRQVDFTVASDVVDNGNTGADDNNNAEGKETPTFKSATLKTGNKALGIGDDDKYAIEFNTTDKLTTKEIEKWLASKDLAVTVNGVKYTNGLTGVKENNFLVNAKDPVYGGAKDTLYLAANGFTQEKNTVTVSAEGYKTVTFEVAKQNGTNPVTPAPEPTPVTPSPEPVQPTPQPEEPAQGDDPNVAEDPAGTGKVTVEGAREFGFKESTFVKATGTGYYSDVDKYIVEFQPKTEDKDVDRYSDPVAVWLGGTRDRKTSKWNSIEVTVNGKEYNKTSRSLQDGQFKVGVKNSAYGGADKYLILAADGLTEEENTIVVKSTSGYELTFKVARDASLAPVKPNPNPVVDEDDDTPVDDDSTSNEDTTLADAPNYVTSGGTSVLSPFKISLRTNDKNFKTESEIAKQFVTADSFKVTLNGRTLPKASRRNYPENGYYETSTGSSATSVVTIPAKFLSNGDTITLQADGYKPITITITK